MKRFFYLLIPVLLFSCSTKTKEKVKERSHTSMCDCYITEFETKHERSQKDQDFLNSCISYLDSFTEEELNVKVEQFRESDCFNNYLWSFGDEDTESLGSFESALKIKPKPNQLP